MIKLLVKYINLNDSQFRQMNIISSIVSMAINLGPCHSPFRKNKLLFFKENYINIYFKLFFLNIYFIYLLVYSF